jgi:23S rRNA (cytosine1962-C5)-methyltransferase
MIMKRIILKPGEEKRILLGHPWVYDNEAAGILAGPGSAQAAVCESGEIADVESSAKTYLGRAFVNPRSKIIARIYSPSKEGADKGFFKRRFRQALARRRACGTDLCRESYRLAFAEADFLPGLIIDRFTGWPLNKFSLNKFSLNSFREAPPGGPSGYAAVEDALGPASSWLTVQFLCYGMDARRDLILEALEEVLAAPLSVGEAAPGRPEGIYEKSAARVRELEGLPLREGLLKGSFPKEGVVILENGLPFVIHFEEGQKTGHYMDQKDNRRLVREVCTKMLSERASLRVLDAFCYTGGFGIHAAASGASPVVCVDSSATALETLRENAVLNGLNDRIGAVQADVFDFLRQTERLKERFGLIILDPPAFAKSRPSLNDALRGYKEINLRALRLLEAGGILVSCSCSQALDASRFRRMIAEAARDADRRLHLLDFRFQGQDHPVLAGYDESLYLKCAFYRAVD